MRTALVFLLAVGAALAATAPLAHAAEAVVQKQRPPYYVDDPVLIRVTAQGFEEDPQPQCVHRGATEGFDLSLVSATPSVSSMVRIVNGRRSEERTVTWTFDYHATIHTPGTYVVGPFRVTQGSTSAGTDTVSISAREVPVEPNMHVALRLPTEPVFPGQRVDVEIEWAYGGSLDAVDDLTIRAPLFDQFHFEDVEAGRRDTALPLTTAKGVVNVKATAERGRVGSTDGIVVKAHRTLVPDRPGTFDLGPITVSLNKVVRWRRTFFGDREPAAVTRVRAVGKPMRLVVKDLPSEGRPESFAGAIGRGFTLSVHADRSVVRVGDPITLTLKLRGDGNLENAGLPPLSADGGLDPKVFRLPTEEVPGTVEGGVKTFHVTVRVLAEAQGEIPAIAYSWFDPEAVAYRTTRSDPIALQVGEAKVVSARDVVSAPDSGEPAERTTRASPARPRFDVTGADLSIRTEPDDVLVDEADRYGGAMLRLALYVLGGLLLLAAFLGLRRAQVDPRVLERRALIETQRRALAEADTLDAADGCRSAAGALRALQAAVGTTLKSDLERAAAECDAAAYAPGASVAGGSMDAALLERAKTLVDRAEKEVEA